MGIQKDTAVEGVKMVIKYMTDSISCHQINATQSTKKEPSIIMFGEDLEKL